MLAAECLGWAVKLATRISPAVPARARIDPSGRGVKLAILVLAALTW